MADVHKQAAATGAPFLHPAPSVAGVMRHVLFALAPAAIAYVSFFGPGFIINCLAACITALVCEALILRARGLPVAKFVGDYSAVVTAILLAFALPPLTPWWVTVSGTVFAIAIAKHAFGGIGFNLFNPAMAGYVAVLLSYPDLLTTWLPPPLGDLDYQPPGLGATLNYFATGNLPDGQSLDAITRATPLDAVKTGLGQMLTLGEIRADSVFGDFGGRGWEWIANFVALGGLWLLYKHIIRWHIPVALVGGLLLPATIMYLVDPATHPSPGFHLFSGGAMLAAFFIATDPVTAPSSNVGRILFGVLTGVLTYCIRTWGAYPDGIAFAVLLMNAAVPLIDRYTRPPVYGRG
jgi:electron transport complex protein RnfD